MEMDLEKLVLDTLNMNKTNNIPLVSICCQTYNHKNYIRKAIESFLMQKTNFPIEIFLRDDASTDGTAEIVKEYSEKYPDLINPLIYTENQWQKGVSPFFDNAKRARGKYIALCEGDDYWTDPYKLQKQVDFLENNPDYGLVYTLYDAYYESEKEVKSFTKDELHIFKKGEVFEELLKNDFIGTLTVVVRSNYLKDALAKLNSNVYRWKMGDYPLWLEIAKYHKIGFINISTAVYRIHAKSVSSHHDKIKFLEFQLSAYDLRNYFIQKYSCSEEIREIILLKYSKLVLRYCYLVPLNNIFNKKQIKQALKEFRFLNTGMGLRYLLYYIGAVNKIGRIFAKILLKIYYSEGKDDFAPRKLN